MSELDAEPTVLSKGEPIPLNRRIDPSAVWTVFAMTVDRLVRGRRLLVLSLFFALPIGIVLLARYYNPTYSEEIDEVEQVLIFYMIPQALVPLTALVFASGMVQDEVEDQTWTYLLIRPLPRWSIYVAKLAGTLAVAIGVTAVFTTITLGAIHWGQPDFWGEILPKRALGVSALLALATLAYGSIFGCLSLLVKKTLVVGVAYVILFEGVFANIDFVVRKATVMYYLRVIAERWLGLHVETWNLDLDLAPSGTTALLTLLGASLATTILAGVVVSIREFRVKTPEGS
jgi:ABC-2 type transport system permease protein